MAELKTFTRQEVSERNAEGATMFIIDDVVYSVSAFLDEHPGGHEVLVAAGGGDASEDFEDVGHSADAKELMRRYAVGALAAPERTPRARRVRPWDAAEAPPPARPGGVLASWTLPVLAGLLLTMLYSWLLA